MVTDKPFKMASPMKKSVGPGDYYGTLSGKLPHEPVSGGQLPHVQVSRGRCRLRGKCAAAGKLLSVPKDDGSYMNYAPYDPIVPLS